MKVERRDDLREREVLTAMILSDAVAGRIAARWDGQLFASPTANAVANLIVEHYRKFEKAPRKAMRSLITEWADGRDDDTVRLAETLLEGLSDDWAQARREVNPDHALDVAGAYFNKVRMTRLKDALESHLAAGKVKAAEDAVADIVTNKVQLGTTSAIDPLRDDAFIRSVFDNPIQSLIKIPGAMGRFYGDVLSQDSMVTFIAGEKVGKSQMLLDIAYRAVRQRIKTAFFGMGDMSEKQMAMRLYSRIAKVPYSSSDGRWPVTVRWPTAMRRSQGQELPDVEYKTVEFDHPIKYQEAKEALHRFMVKDIKSKRSLFRWSFFPTDTGTVADIESVLNAWELEGWGEARVVVIDYADILAPEKGQRMEMRDNINRTWGRLRSLSLKKHLLIVTATQANREAYDAKTINRRHVSEDKRKWSHCTAAIGINVSAEEKENQLMRLNYVMRREGEYSWKKALHVAQCLALANPCVLSCF